MSLFSEYPFMPHGHCFLWRPDILALHVISDALIALSYYSIPVVIYLFARRRPDFKYRTLLFMFALFIVACGTTHVFSIWNFWHSHYWLSGTVKAITALISAATAIVIWPLLPQLLKIPNPAELERARSRLVELRKSILRVIHRDALESFGDDTEIDVVERHVREYVEDLKNSQLALQSANFSQIRFLTNMSHELRTPLGGISGYVDRLRVDESVLPQHREILERIKAASDHLTGLVNDILDISKVEAGKLEVESDEVRLDQLLLSISGVISAQMRPAVSFKVSFTSQVPTTIETDALRLKQILLNLLSNAAKFTDRGLVELSVSYASNGSDGGDLVFLVTDNGVGIPADKIDRLFKPFSQVDDSLTRRSSGSGLGLVLSRQLARKMRGDLILERSQPGVGSTFRLNLRVRHPANAAMFSSLESKKQVQPAGELSLTMLQGRLTGKRVLLVEDGVDNQNVVSYFLRLAGADVEIAENGKIGVQMALAGTYDVVLMDIQMPVMDGYAALTALKDARYRVPVIALTAHAMRDERMKCVQAGFADYLAKPIDVLKMIKTLELYL